MEPLSAQRCYNHADREAVVRCPACHHFFCRECVTEHDDRMLCSACLSQLTVAVRDLRWHWLRRAVWLAQGAFGFVLLWGAFYLIGQLLLSVPHAFHEGAFWEGRWGGAP